MRSRARPGAETLGGHLDVVAGDGNARIERDYAAAIAGGVTAAAAVAADRAGAAEADSGERDEHAERALHRTSTRQVRRWMHVDRRERAREIGVGARHRAVVTILDLDAQLQKVARHVALRIERDAVAGDAVSGCRVPPGGTIDQWNSVVPSTGSFGTDGYGSRSSVTTSTWNSVGSVSGSVVPGSVVAAGAHWATHGS